MKSHVKKRGELHSKERRRIVRAAASAVGRPAPPIEICVLAGGLSSRMGRDKSKMRLGKSTLLSHIRRVAEATKQPVRVIRRDLVSRCGPLGGIYTALKTTPADAVLFLACDMPQVSEALLSKLMAQLTARTRAVFTWNDTTAGFPFLLRQSLLPAVEQLLDKKKYSLQILAQKTGAKKFIVRHAFESELTNINTPEDWQSLKAMLKKD